MQRLSLAPADLRAAIEAQLAPARRLRRTLHSAPDLSGNEIGTRSALLDHLPEGAVEYVADTGAVVRFGGEGPAVAIRAELDALPIHEASGYEWSSTNGAMHACGHDIHMAAAAALAHCWQQLPIPIVLILQPREETNPSGARDIMESGVLVKHRVAAVVAAHVQPLLERGTIAASPGAVNASSDEFQVTMSGTGGHAAYPHLGADPVVAISQFVVAAQQLVSRNSDPMEASVVSVGVLSAGSSPNIRPNEASARGTIRTLSTAHRPVLLERLRATAHGTAMAAGCSAQVEIDHGEPALVNDPSTAAFAGEYLTDLGFTPKADLYSCGADDFAYFSESYPSLMMFVGTGSETGRLHDSSFLPPDSVVDDVAKSLLAGVLAAAQSIGAAQ